MIDIEKLKALALEVKRLDVAMKTDHEFRAYGEASMRFDNALSPDVCLELLAELLHLRRFQDGVQGDLL